MNPANGLEEFTRKPLNRLTFSVLMNIIDAGGVRWIPLGQYHRCCSRKDGRPLDGGLQAPDGNEARTRHPSNVIVIKAEYLLLGVIQSQLPIAPRQKSHSAVGDDSSGIPCHAWFQRFCVFGIPALGAGICRLEECAGNDICDLTSGALVVVDNIDEPIIDDSKIRHSLRLINSSGLHLLSQQMNIGSDVPVRVPTSAREH